MLTPVQPPVKLLRALDAQRTAIAHAFRKRLEVAISLTDRMRPAPRSREVAILCHFFLNFSRLQASLSDALNPSGVKVEVKGVFGHHSRPYGPVVDFEGSPPGCELCDMMFIVTCGRQPGSRAVGNASFFQAKMDRSSMLTSSPSSKRQAALYSQASWFTHRNLSAYGSGLPDHPTTPGWREMPGSSTDGFCFWTFDRQDRRPRAWHWVRHNSAVIPPSSFANRAGGQAFGEAMFGLLTGRFGLSVESPCGSDFGWNRIVHDFLFRAANEPLGYTYGVANAADVHRDYWGKNVGALLRSGIPLAANPFHELFGAFDSPALNKLAIIYDAQKNRLTRQRLNTILSNFGDGEAGDREPPADDAEPRPNDPGGGGSFININISLN